MVMTSYQPKALPIDDDGFVRSFALGDDHQLCEEGLAFFAQQGFVVVNSVRWSALHAPANMAGPKLLLLVIRSGERSRWEGRWMILARRIGRS